MKILGIESTCDETSAAVVENGRKILSNVVASSASMHKKYGGIVPEVAAREQIKVIIPTIQECLRESRVESQDLDAIAIAYGPGLIGSLLIGTETARVLALAWNKSLIGVNHLVGHIYANWLSVDSSQLTEKSKTGRKPLTANRQPEFPLIALVVSGGHTDLILMKGQGHFKWLGGTRDDSAGEAFDKVARVLGLSYPGGPEIERVARNYKLQITNCKLPRPMMGSKDFDFSFSGLKTAVVNMVGQKSDVEGQRSAIAYEFQEAVCDVLINKTFAAAQKFKAKTIVVGGGVAANGKLREKMKAAGLKNGFRIFFPDKSLSIDNGAMIAAAGFYERNIVDPLTLRANPGLHF